MEFTKEQLAMAFNEWMRRYTEDHNQFCRERKIVHVFLSQANAGQEPSYGSICAEYLQLLVTAISKDAPDDWREKWEDGGGK